MLVGFFFALAITGCQSEKMESAEVISEENGNFDPHHVLHVEITMEDADWFQMCSETRTFFSEFNGDCMAQPFTNTYTTFPASLSIDGQFQPTVGIRKKGFIGSQSTEKPSLKINIDEYIDGAELFGVDNVTLNNAVQDPSLIRQCLAYGVFSKAGYPAPRCNFAKVYVNDQEIGVYAHVEPIKRSFLRDRFGSDDGDLYEGTISDFRSQWISTYDAKTIDTDASLTHIMELAVLLEAEDVSLTDLERYLDVDMFLTFWALEIMTGHWDGYNGSLNNYYMYRDPSTDKFVFIPWGLDDTFDPGVIEEPPFLSSILANRLLQNPEAEERFTQRINDLFSTVWDETELLSEVDRIENMLSEFTDMTDRAAAIDGVRQYIRERRSSLLAVFPGEVYDLYPPSCIVEKATLDAEFSTHWGTIEYANPFEDGELNLEVVWEGEEVVFSSAGVVVGQDAEGPALMMGASIDANNGAMLLPYISLDMGAIEPEVPMNLDDMIIGGVYYTETAYWGEWIFLGYLVGGELEFDLFDTEMGSEVKGSLSTSIYIWEANE